VKLLNSLRAWLHLNSRDEAPEQKVRRNSRREREIYKLVRTGEITLAQIEGNHKAKELHRLRQLGYVKPLGDPDCERWEVSATTGCRYKVYKWTGKLPPNWVSSDSFTGVDRRSKPRGQNQSTKA
jgi:hypothetical protein